MSFSWTSLPIGELLALCFLKASRRTSLFHDFVGGKKEEASTVKKL
jgi:hypothetical protein